MSNQSSVRVYDLPTRLFHWTFVFLFAFAFFIAKTMDDDSPQYAYHMLAGLMLVSAVILRVVWGVFGSPHSRFTNFRLNPNELMSYFKDILGGSSRKYFSHNPASSWAALIMMVCAIGLAGTGLMMAQKINKDFFEDIHEVFGNVLLVTAIAHVLGIVVHTIRHRDPIGLAMVHGNKSSTGNYADQPKPASQQWVAAFIFLFAMGTVANHLRQNYDPNQGVLKLFGTQLHLGENEDDEKKTEGTQNSEKSETSEKSEDHDD